MAGLPYITEIGLRKHVDQLAIIKRPGTDISKKEYEGTLGCEGSRNSEVQKNFYLWVGEKKAPMVPIKSNDIISVRIHPYNDNIFRRYRVVLKYQK